MLKNGVGAQGVHIGMAHPNNLCGPEKPWVLLSEVPSRSGYAEIAIGTSLILRY